MEEEHSFCLMKENSKEISAIGLRMKKMEQKDSWMPQKMYFGSGMTMTILGIREDSKEEEQGKEKEKEEKEKEKDDKDEDFSDLETKEKEKEREKERITLQVMRVIGLKMNEWQGNETDNWNEGYWAYEDETAWQSQAWDEWQEDYYDEYGYFQGKGKKGKKGKGKGKKGHGTQDQGKGQGDGKGEANYVNPSHSSQQNPQQAALPSSSNASGFFVTHSSMYLTPVKMIENEDQQKEPDSSGCAFLGQRGRHGFPHRKSDATHSGNLRSWLYKSYGLQECYQCFL